MVCLRGYGRREKVGQLSYKHSSTITKTGIKNELHNCFLKIFSTLKTYLCFAYRPMISFRTAENVFQKKKSYVKDSSLHASIHKFVFTLFIILKFQGANAFCPSQCQCDDVGLKTQCVNAELDVVPILLNPGTKEFDLSHNHIKTILPGFAFYHELRYLDLSHNEIVSLGAQNFGTQKSLHTLVVSNNKISRVQNRAFLGLPLLQDLVLSDNYIESIENNAFNALPDLHSLDLSNNRLENLSSQIFLKLKNLRSLNLCKNDLKNISSVVFEPLRELQELDLCSNEITVLQDFAFKTLKSLINLSLYSNKIQHVKPKAFVGLNSLKLLHMHDNLLEKVPRKSLREIKDLEELNISLNPIVHLESETFNELPNLVSLHISHCENLSLVEIDVFSGLEKLVFLEMGFNKNIFSLSADIFAPLTELRRLVLRGNRLKTFDGAIIHRSSLQYLDLRDNEFECNCSLKWLQTSSLNKSLGLALEEISCYSPEHLKGRVISGVSDYEMECYSHIAILIACCVASAAVFAILGILAIIYYKNCRKMKTLVHDNWPEKIVATWRDPEYEKQVEDEEYTFHSLRGIHHIPVTVI